MLETVNISTRTCKMSVFNNDLRHQQLYVVLREISRKHDRQKIIMMPLKLICQRDTALSQDMLNANKQCNIIQEKKRA